MNSRNRYEPLPSFSTLLRDTVTGSVVNPLGMQAELNEYQRRARHIQEALGEDWSHAPWEAAAVAAIREVLASGPKHAQQVFGDVNPAPSQQEARKVPDEVLASGPNHAQQVFGDLHHVIAHVKYDPPLIYRPSEGSAPVPAPSQQEARIVGQLSAAVFVGYDFRRDLYLGVVKGGTGQIGFPGGKGLEGEKPWFTACRETAEETGFHLSRKRCIRLPVLDDDEGRPVHAWCDLLSDAEVRDSEEGAVCWVSRATLTGRWARFPRYNEAILQAFHKVFSVNNAESCNLCGEYCADCQTRCSNSFCPMASR